MTSQARRSSFEHAPETRPDEIARDAVHAESPPSRTDVSSDDPEQRRRTLEALESVRRQLEQTQRTLDAFVTSLTGTADDGTAPKRNTSAA
jgi:hypothetical protein